MKTMKKTFFFLLAVFLLSTANAQDSKETNTKAKAPHLIFTLHQNEFYYSKGAEKEKVKLEELDSAAIAKIIEVAIIENKVDKKDLNVHMQGDDLLDHPKFEVLLNTILSKTVSEVRVKTNVFE